jgi:hypothetical protein
MCTALGEGCSCVPRERSCELLNTDDVFIGRVVSIKEARHEREKDSWSPGYSMHVAIEQHLKGVGLAEVDVETGAGFGDCGTPMPVGTRALFFAYRANSGELWTGLCSGTTVLKGSSEEDRLVAIYRERIKTGVGTVFGEVTQSKVIWREDEVQESRERPMDRQRVILHGDGGITREVSTGKDGKFELDGLTPGHYNLELMHAGTWDYSHEYPSWYEAELRSGGCKRVGFKLLRNSRIAGHIELPSEWKDKTIEVVALPVSLKRTNQFSGISDYTDSDGAFDLWPLPAGDYYVGVNLAAPPKPDQPFRPTWFPGVTQRSSAQILHVPEGKPIQIAFPVREIATAKVIHFVALGADGKPLRHVYIQREDLARPGDASSYENVDLDDQGRGSVTVYAGYDYHLHASHFVRYGEEWCAPPVRIHAARESNEVRFNLDQKSANCDLNEIDREQRVE